MGNLIKIISKMYVKTKLRSSYLQRSGPGYFLLEVFTIKTFTLSIILSRLVTIILSRLVTIILTIFSLQIPTRKTQTTFFAWNSQCRTSLPERLKLGPKAYWAVPVLVILKTSLLTPSFV